MSQNLQFQYPKKKKYLLDQRLQVMTQQENFSGRWTIEEHQKFLMGLQLYGKNWKKIEELIGNRTCSQIRSHAQKYFLKVKKQSKRKPPIATLQTQLYHLEVPSQSESPIQKQYLSYSYFMNKIIEFTRSHQHLDIWEALIDSKPLKETVTNCQHEVNSKNMTIQENIEERT